MALDFISFAINEFDDEDQAILRPFVILWHEKYDVYALTSPRLAGLYARRDALDILMTRGGSYKEVTFSDNGTNVSLSDKAKNLQSLLESVNAEIAMLLRKINASKGVAVGQLVTTSSIPQPCPWGIDASSPAVNGSPYERGTWRGRY